MTELHNGRENTGSQGSHSNSEGVTRVATDTKRGRKKFISILSQKLVEKMEKIAQFNFLNATDLESKHLICFGCEDWLVTTIYQVSDGHNYCDVCVVKYIDAQSTITVNLLLEDLHEGFKYPCKYCDFVGIASELIEHVKVCLHRPLKCLFCNKKDLHELNSAIHLLSKHSDKVISMNINERNAILKLKTPLSMFILNYKENYFVIKVEQLDGMISFLITQQAIEGIPLISNFAIIFESGYTKTTLNAKVHQIKSILENHSHILKEKLYLKEKEEMIDFRIDFSEHEKLLMDAIDECPICFNSLNSEMFQCKNGHCVCTNCKQILNTCPTCRLPMQDVPLSLKHVLSSYYFPCKHADAGCLHVAKLDEIDDHHTNCVYRKVKCEDCQESHLKYKITRHMADDEIYKIRPNYFLFQYHCNELESTGCADIKYKNFIFRFTLKYTLDKCILVNVRPLYCNDRAIAKHFRYELQISDQDRGVLVKVANICQIESDLYNGTMDLTPYNEYRLKNNIQVVYLRAIVFEIDV